MKNIQIPYELFLYLLHYHLFDEKENEKEIQEGLERKLDSMVRRELYTKSKSAESADEREKARQEYLDRRGILDSFRW